MNDDNINTISIEDNVQYDDILQAAAQVFNNSHFRSGQLALSTTPEMLKLLNSPIASAHPHYKAFREVSKLIMVEEAMRQQNVDSIDDVKGLAEEDHKKPAETAIRQIYNGSRKEIYRKAYQGIVSALGYKDVALNALLDMDKPVFEDPEEKKEKPKFPPLPKRTIQPKNKPLSDRAIATLDAKAQEDAIAELNTIISGALKRKSSLKRDHIAETFIEIYNASIKKPKLRYALPKGIKGNSRITLEDLLTEDPKNNENVEKGARKRHITKPRQILAYVLQSLLIDGKDSGPSIGAYIGNRDHTTILYSRRVVIQKLKDKDAYTQDIILNLAKALNLSQTFTDKLVLGQYDQKYKKENKANWWELALNPPENLKLTEETREKLAFSIQKHWDNATINAQEELKTHISSKNETLNDFFKTAALYIQHRVNFEKVASKSSITPSKYEAMPAFSSVIDALHNNFEFNFAVLNSMQENDFNRQERDLVLNEPP